MSSALANAAPLKAEIRLAQAVSCFEADLSSDQKAALRAQRAESSKSPPDGRDVMRLTAEIDRRTAGKLGGGRCFGPRMTNVLQAIQQFAALGDLVVGGSQNIIACGVWSLVRMTLLSIINLSSYLEKTSTFLMVAGRSAPRYQHMALLYPRSKNLQSQLSEYFIVIVRFCHHLLAMSKKSIFGQLLSFPSDSELKSYQSDLDQWANAMREEVRLLMARNFEEQSSGLKSLIQFSESQSHRQRQKARLRVLEACSTYDHQTTWKEIRKAGTTALFSQMPAYEQWKTGPESCTLVCRGKLGSGKSVMMANIIDDLHLDVQTSQCPVAYFFCRYDISDSLKARTVICSLARQLLNSIPNLTRAEKLIGDTKSVADSKKALDTLRRVLPPTFKAYFVLDGLDECEGDEIPALIKDVQELQNTFTLLVCVSSRLEADNVLRWSPDQFAKHNTITLPDENPDIVAFINAELGRCIESGRLTVGDPTLALDIEDALVQGAQGMFLWVALQIGSLCAAKTDEAIRKALSDLPKNLSQTFARILQKSGELGKDYQTRSLKLVTAAYRPLTTEELREALSVAVGNTTWDQARLLNDISSALACCGGLVTVDEEDSTVRLIHHSVKQFLLGEFEHLDEAVFTIDAAHETMGKTVATYLSYSAFETQLSTGVVPQLERLAESAPHKIIHSTGAPSNVRRLAVKLLQSRKQPDFNIGKVLADASKRFQLSPTDQFQFLAYAKAYWVRHAFYIPDHDTAILGLLPRLGLLWKGKTATDAESEQLLFHAARDGKQIMVTTLVNNGVPVDTIDSQFYQTPLMWASKNGHEPIARYLLDNGAYIEAGDFDGQTPLIRTAANGHNAVIRLLLERGAEIERRDHNRQTPLLRAAANGQERTVQMLLLAKADLEACDMHRQTPLLRAAANGHAHAANVLLNYGALIEWKDKRDRTPLLCAAENGHEAMARLLLDAGADDDATDVDGRGALYLATMYGRGSAMIMNATINSPLIHPEVEDKRLDGYKAVVELFLANGANIDARDKAQQTPLMEAAAQGLSDIVRVLLDKGARVDATCDALRTPLWWAAANGHANVVWLLLVGGANADMGDDNNDMPLTMASRNGHTHVVQVLEDWLQDGERPRLKRRNASSQLF
ncbi:NACHT domain protein [Lasiosphaeria ovina]|uniref:NACHT domain protein n=1 Tax=Lasiosphaeria ovina TaxID=92902 RepID=A0AAE0NA62_9PEZI|nr:NACHT domain protein [Lasiosphaeria ovina]